MLQKRKKMNQKKEKDITDEKDTNIIIIAIIVSVIIILLWLSSYYFLKDFPEKERGTIGDMFGSVNSLFSGLALAGIILTILLQKKELKFQREELKQTRKEFEIQNETLKIQRFENTFFSLLNQHHQIVNTIDLTYYKKKEKEGGTYFRSIKDRMQPPQNELEVVVINGRDVFKYRYIFLFEELKEITSKDNYEQIYFNHYQEAQTDFGHYFRNLYRMMKIVDETDFFYDLSKVTEKEILETKYKYSSIIRAQISDYELLWIFYNCLSENGIEKFKPLIEKYSFLKNLPKNLIAHPEHINFYEKKAFIPYV